MVEPVRPITLADVEDARERISGTVLRTPLVRLDLGSGSAEIYLKLENLQPTNSYKLRGAVTQSAASDEEARARRWTQAGKGGRRALPVCSRRPCSGVAIETRRRPSSSGCGQWRDSSVS